MGSPLSGQSTDSNIPGVLGENGASTGLGAGAFERSQTGEGVHGETNSTHFAGVTGIATNPDTDGVAVFGSNEDRGAGFWKKRLRGKALKLWFFKAAAFSFCFEIAIFLLAAPSISEPERTGTVQQPYLVGPPPKLTRLVKQSINIDICGPGLSPSPVDRQNLQNDVKTAVIAWVEPMRIFGAPLTQPTDIVMGFCGANQKTRTVRHKENCEVVKAIICDVTDVKEKIPSDLNVLVETDATIRKFWKDQKPPIDSNRSFYLSSTDTIHLLAGEKYETILHEVGHAIGLGDVYAEGGFFCDIHHGEYAPTSTSVMCNANFPSLQPDDIAGAQHVYCTVFPNDCTRGVLTVEPNLDRPGQDYTNFELSSADYRPCYDRCANDDNCSAYTYVPPGVQGSDARCWLKNALPASKATVGMVSGYKP